MWDVRSSDAGFYHRAWCWYLGLNLGWLLGSFSVLLDLHVQCRYLMCSIDMVVPSSTVTVHSSGTVFCGFLGILHSARANLRNSIQTEACPILADSTQWQVQNLSVHTPFPLPMWIVHQNEWIPVSQQICTRISLKWTSLRLKFWVWFLIRHYGTFCTGLSFNIGVLVLTHTFAWVRRRLTCSRRENSEKK